MSIENYGKLFWETCKPYFSSKGIKTLANIILSDKEGLILKEMEVVWEFNIYFQSIKLSLGFSKCHNSSASLNEPDPVERLVKKHKNHPNLKKIKSKCITVKLFLSNQLLPRMSLMSFLHYLIQSHLSQTNYLKDFKGKQNISTSSVSMDKQFS